jgi:hypothetical protein
MTTAEEMAKRAGLDVQPGDVVVRASGTSRHHRGAGSSAVYFTVIALRDAVAYALAREKKDVTTYALELEKDAKRAAIAVATRLHSLRVTRDEDGRLRLKGVSECDGLAEVVRQWIAAEIPLEPPAPHTKDGKRVWRAAMAIHDELMVGASESPRVSVWLELLVRMVWHEVTKKRATKGAVAMPMGVVESVTRLGGKIGVLADSSGEVQIIDKGEVIATADETAILRGFRGDIAAKFPQGKLAEMEDGAGLEVVNPDSGAVLVDHSAVQEVAFAIFAKEMNNAVLPMVFHALARRATELWAMGNRTSRLVFPDGVAGLAKLTGLKGNKSPQQVIGALKIMESLQPRTHYKSGKVTTLGLLTATGYEGGRGRRSELVVNLNDCMLPGYAAALKERGITGQWLVALQSLELDHDRWRRQFGARGLPGARRFNLALPCLFLPGEGKSIDSTGSMKISDDEILEFADRCKWNLKPKKLSEAKHLLVSPPAEGDGQLMIPGVATAPLERVDGGAVDDEDGRYRLADPMARMQSLANHATSRQAKLRRARKG